MITNLKDFIAEKAKNPRAFQYLKENFDDNDMPLLTSGDDVEDEMETDELTFEQFKDLVVAEHEKATSEIEEGMEAPEMPTDEQLNMIFNVVQNLNCETTDMDTDDNDLLEEGLGDFMRGGSKEEIEAKKQGAIARLKEIEAKFTGKNLVFQEYGDNKTTPYNMADALKIIGKNNFLGTIQTFDKGDKVILLYKEGQKGMNKLGVGTGAQTSGQ